MTPVTVEKCNTVDPASIHDHDTEGVSLLLGRVLLNAVLNIKVHTVNFLILKKMSFADLV